MSQITSFGNGGGGGAIVQINGNTGFAVGPIINLQTGQEATLVFVGDDANNMALLTTDINQNVALGTDALSSINAGSSRNTAIGFQAMMSLVSTGDNVAVGYNAGSAYVGAETNNIVLGANVTGTAAETNSIHIGDDGTRTTCFIGGIDGVDVGSTAQVVTLGTAGTVNQLGTAVITAGSGITVTPGANTITIAASGGGGITTINGNVGSITGDPVTIESTGNGTVFTDGSGSTMNIEFTDINLNTAVGAGSFASVTSGALNTFLGYNSGNSNQDGLSNVGVGYQALLSNHSGTGNVAIGRTSVVSMDGGNFNTCVGYFAGSGLSGTDSNNIIIGLTTSASESGAIRIGDGGNNITFFAGGIGGVNVGSTANVVTSSTTSTNGTQLGTAAITAGAGITVTPGANTITIAASGAGDGMLFTGGDVQISATGTVVFTGLSASSPTTTEAIAQMPCSSSGTLKNLYVKSRLNSSTTDVTITLRVNGVSTAMVATIPALTTGVFSDTVNTVAVSAGDLIDWMADASTVGSIQGGIIMTFNS